MKDYKLPETNEFQIDEFDMCEMEIDHFFEDLKRQSVKTGKLLIVWNMSEIVYISQEPSKDRGLAEAIAKTVRKIRA